MENKIITFLHSGDAGDIIAGLATVKEICEKENAKAILFLDTTGGTSCNDDDLNNLVLVQTKGKGLKFNDKVADFIIPVIKIQPYIISVEKWNPSLEIKIDYNLNIFREKFIDIDVIKKTNQNLMFLHQCAVGLDFGYKGPWLSCDDFDNSEKHKIVIGRSSRCQSAHAFFSIYEDILKKDAEFIGTDFEYELYNNCFQYYPKRLDLKDNALNALRIIKNSEVALFNSTLFYWLAVGIGHNNIIHEIPIDIPTSYFPNQNPQIRYVIGAEFVI